MRDGHSSGAPVTRRLKQPTRTAGSGHHPEARACARLRAVPIRSCSRWGLPCRRRYRRRGALLPHLFTLTAAQEPPRRYVFCGTVPGFAPAGCYPAPLVRGARTFLSGNLSVLPQRPSDRLTSSGMVISKHSVKAPQGQSPYNLKDQGAVRSIAVRARAAIARGRPRLARSSCSVLRVDGSAWPSTRSGRKWR